MRKPDFHFRALLSIVVAFATLLPPAHTQQQTSPQSFPFMNPAFPIDQRVNDLIGRMTLEEKVSQMPDHSPAIPRLEVPKYDWWNEGLHGVAFAGYATNFPQVIGMAATWDTSLVHRMGETISTEARAKYNQAMREDRHEMFFGLTFWATNINIFRDPRWGRGQETYGEDPYLTGRMGVAFVTGIQGDDPKYLKLVSTPKHYAVHSGPEPTRHRITSMYRLTILRTPISQPFALRLPRRMPSPSCAPTTQLTGRLPARTPCSCAITFATPGTLTVISLVIAQQ